MKFGLLFVNTGAFVHPHGVRDLANAAESGGDRVAVDCRARARSGGLPFALSLLEDGAHAGDRGHADSRIRSCGSASPPPSPRPSSSPPGSSFCRSVSPPTSPSSSRPSTCSRAAGRSRGSASAGSRRSSRPSACRSRNGAPGPTRASRPCGASGLLVPEPFRGRYYRWDAVESNPRPVQPGGVPIVVGGHSAPAARRAARLGDGFFPGSRHAGGARKAVRHRPRGMRAHRARSGGSRAHLRWPGAGAGRPRALCGPRGLALRREPAGPGRRRAAAGA